jgi:hypothetical protein
MKVKQIKEDKIINIYNSVSEASKKTKIKRDIILKCCKGKQNSTKGFIFNYAN